MSTITLTKMSAPGWEKTFSHWALAYNELRHWICPDCKTSFHYRYHQVLQEEVASGTSRDEAMQTAEEEAQWCLPDNFMSLDDEQKTEYLLDTACGAEFLLDVDNE